MTKTLQNQTILYQNLYDMQIFKKITMLFYSRVLNL